ncbi:MAG: GNAT family N-acetyltransferase [Bacillota bacterium]
MELTFAPTSPQRLARLIELMEMEEYLGPTLELLGMSREEFRQLLTRVGQLYSAFDGDREVGYVWVERRDRVLHLHGLVIEPEYQGKGIGSAIMRWLETSYGSQADVIELGVHESNRRARQLYERSGFTVVRTMPAVGFLIMQRPLSTA